MSALHALTHTSIRARCYIVTAVKNENMNEKLIERKIREEVKRLGGQAIKFASPFFTGMPDRLVLMPGGRVWFVEVKSTGKAATIRQLVVIEMLKQLGFKALVIDGKEQFEKFINELNNGI